MTLFCAYHGYFKSPYLSDWENKACMITNKEQLNKTAVVGHFSKAVVNNLKRGPHQEVGDPCHA